MTIVHASRRIAQPIVAAAAIFFASGAAFAGECPADKVTQNFVHPGGIAPVAVTDEVLASIDLAQTTVDADGRVFRLRRLDIQPGGVVPLHSHADRPAILHMGEGTIVEYSSDCAVPIVHRPGDVIIEAGNTEHWWRNEGDKLVVIFASDILHVEDDAHTM
ncbi:MAG TPA: cupin domain-containing protein [Kiloniellales bacterium]|nr:cupin domain-containing protein [Kiloniellales bacterium]